MTDLPSMTTSQRSEIDLLKQDIIGAEIRATVAEIRVDVLKQHVEALEKLVKYNFELDGKELLRECLDCLEDCWNQFAYDGKDGKWSGGLSTLEWLEEFIPKVRKYIA